jgi:hypothetical protein
MTITLKVKNPRLVAAGIKGGNAILEKYGRDHYSRMGKTPARVGKKRGRPAIAYVIGNDGLIFSGKDAVRLAQESKTELNPAREEPY